MPFPIDLQKNMARTQIVVKNSDFFTSGLILVTHIIYQLLVMICKLLHHLKHPNPHLLRWLLNLTVTVKWPGCLATALFRASKAWHDSGCFNFILLPQQSLKCELPQLLTLSQSDSHQLINVIDKKYEYESE